eukprot:g8275.t1
MANLVTHAQGTSKSLQNTRETLRTNVKDLNDTRETSCPMPITNTRSRKNSASNGSLLFDIELSASWRNCAELSPGGSIKEDTLLPHRSRGSGIRRLINQSLTPSTDLEKRVMQAFTLLKGSCKSANGVELELLYEKMKSSGFLVELVGQERPKHSNPGLEFAGAVCCPFLLINGYEELDGELPLQDSSPCILDPYFRSHFEIQHPSQCYSDIMDQFPDAFVGSLSKLERLVRLLCGEMRKSFDEAGLPVPPWRVYSAIILKWSLPCEANESKLTRTPLGYHTTAVGST